MQEGEHVTDSAPIMEPAYWADQLRRAGENLHLSTWWAPRRWLRFHERRHKLVLEKFIKPYHSVFDAACGYGRLLRCMPDNWHGDYLGVDICPEFIALARRSSPCNTFEVGDLRNLWISRRFNWVVVVSMKHSITHHAGQEVWDKMEQQLKLISDNILYLEFDISEEPDYGVPRLCHKEWEKTLTTAAQRDAEDLR